MWINFWNCLKLRCAVESLCLFSSWCMWCVFTQELEISRERLILQIRAAVTGKDRWLQRIARIHTSRATWHSQHEQATVRRSKNKGSYKYLFCHFRAKGNTSDYSPQITVRLFSVPTVWRKGNCGYLFKYNGVQCSSFAHPYFLFIFYSYIKLVALYDVHVQVPCL